MFYKKVDYNSNRACFDFLTNHFEYDTMNSWNGARSIANRVKLYDLPVDTSDALKALEEDDYFSINQTCRDWEEDHPGYSVGFNGRSGGYLVLYKNGTNKHALIGDDYDSPCNYRPQDYEDWKMDVKGDWGSLKAYHSTLVFYVKLVQEFDKLCDDLIDVLRGLIDDMKKRESLTRQFSATRRFERYYYEDEENLKLHMLYMKQQGYSVWEYDTDDLFAEYEMNEDVNGEVVLEQEGDEEFI